MAKNKPAPLRRSPRKHGDSEKAKPVIAVKAKAGKQAEPALPRIDWSADEGALIWELIAQMEVKENRLVLFGKQDKNENTSGESKIAVYKRIGTKILPDLAQTSPNALAKRVKGKAEDLVNTYKKLAKQLQVTGGGLRNDDDDDDDGNDSDGSGVHQFLECYISSEGPDHDTTDRARNIWEKLTEKFEYFPALHRFLAARSNIVPPMVATGVGPDGRKVVHLQPPTQSQRTFDECIDPSLKTPQTPRRSSEDEDEDEDGNSPIDILSSPEVKPTHKKTAALPSSFQRVVDKAKAANAGKQRPKTFEESLVDIQSKMLNAANARENQKLEHDRARLRLEEVNQLLSLHKIGILDNETLAERIKLVNAKYADPPKRPHSPTEAGPSKKPRHHSRTASSSSDVTFGQAWDRNGSSPTPGSDHSLGYR